MISSNVESALPERTMMPPPSSGRGGGKEKQSTSQATNTQKICKIETRFKKWQLLLIYSIIYADASGRVGLKKAKNMLT